MLRKKGCPRAGLKFFNVLRERNASCSDKGMEELQALDEMNRQYLQLLSSISPWTLVGGLIFGILGIWMFRKGRRENNRKVLWVGVALMVYQSFTLEPAPIWGIGLLLAALGYYWS